MRGFARYLRVLDPATEVPPPRLLTDRRSRPTPFLFSDEEVRRLLDATEQLRPPFRAGTYRAVFGLLAATGLRVGEAIALERRDVGLAHRTLTVRQTKFNRSRRLPLLPSVVTALGSYARERDRSGLRPKAPNFFLSMRGDGAPLRVRTRRLRYADPACSVVSRNLSWAPAENDRIVA